MINPVSWLLLIEPPHGCVLNRTLDHSAPGIDIRSEIVVSSTCAVDRAFGVGVSFGANAGAATAMAATLASAAPDFKNGRI